MTTLQSIIYGLIQGLTEFLPISSSAHLVLIPFFTGWADPGLGFDVAMHWGTLIAVITYFRKEAKNLIMGFLGGLKGQRTADTTLSWYILIATIPGAVLGFLLEKQAETIFRSPWILCVTLSAMGIVLFLADLKGSKKLHIQDLSWKKAALIGISQGVALIPGVSRSGITIATGLWLGLERSEAVKFSFFLSMPITLGAGLLKLDYLLHNLNDLAVWTGLFTSCVSGFAAIHILLTHVKTKSFSPFVVYRILLALTVLGFLIFRTH